MNHKELLLQLVSIPSITDSARESEPLRVIQKFLSENSINRIEITQHNEHKYSLVARAGSGQPILLFNSHIDVVPAANSMFKPRIDGDSIYARGAADAKGPLAAMLFAFVELARQNPKRQVILCCVADEENAGNQGSKLLYEQGIEAPFVIVGEPTGMKPIIAEKGFLRFRIDVRGTAAHAAFPEMGSNAIIDMLDITQQILDYDWKATHPLLDKPTIVPALMKGGNKINVVPDAASVSFDMRFLPSQNIYEIIDVVESICAPYNADVSILECGDAFETANVSKLVQVAQTHSKSEPIGIAFGTDARFYKNSEGIVLGPGDPNVAHTDNEHIAISDIKNASDIYVQIANDLLE